MSSWVANAKAQAAYHNVQIQSGGGQLISEGPWQVVVELLFPPDDKSIIVKYDKTNGTWSVH